MSEVPPFSLLTAHDSYLFNQGSHYRLYDKRGARVVTAGRTSGSYFAVWAPNAEPVSMASMLYLDYGRENGERTPNRHGGRENDRTFTPFKSCDLRKLWVRDLNQLYRTELAQREVDCEPAGFEWIDYDDAESSVVSTLRTSKSTANLALALRNSTPMPRDGFWREALNSDGAEYGSCGVGKRGGLDAEPLVQHRRPFFMVLILPPLSVSFFINKP
jgi:1,4-alpha-glucan branching enzyme